MAGDINIGQVIPREGNFGGLAQLAGNRVGNLGLPVPDYSAMVQGGAGIAQGLANIGAGFQHRKDLQAQQAENAANRQQEQSQFLAKLQLEKENQGRLAEQDKQQTAIQNKELEMKQKQFDLNLNKQAADLSREEKKDKLEAMTIGMFNLSQLTENEWKDPKKRSTAISAQVKAGTLSEEDGKSLISMPWSDMRNATKSMFLITGKAAQFKGLDAQTQTQNKSNSAANVIVSPDGTVTINSRPTTTTQNTTQKNILDAKTTRAQLTQSFDVYDKSYAGIGAAAYAWGLNYVSQAHLSSKEQDEWLTGYTQWAASTNMLVLSFIKQLSGVQYNDNQLQYMQAMLPSTKDSDAVIQGKKQMLNQYLDRVEQLNAKILASGIEYSSDPNSPYAQQFLQEAQQAAIDVMNPKKEANGKVANQDMINWYMSKNGVSQDEAIKQIKANGYTIEGEQ